MYINDLGHITKMAAMPIYGKNSSKIFFSKTNRQISMKLGVKHRWLKYYNVYINHDPVMTLTQFMARSTWGIHCIHDGDVNLTFRTEPRKFGKYVVPFAKSVCEFLDLSCHMQHTTVQTLNGLYLVAENTPRTVLSQSVVNVDKYFRETIAIGDFRSQMQFKCALCAYTQMMAKTDLI